MTKTKLSVELHASGDLNDAFIRMITNHNEGRVKIDLDLFAQYGKAEFAKWPSITKVFRFEQNTEALNALEVYENDKHTMTITEKEILELEPSILQEAEERPGTTNSSDDLKDLPVFNTMPKE